MTDSLKRSAVRTHPVCHCCVSSAPRRGAWSSPIASSNPQFRSGFTLIEIAIVCAIIAVLAVIVTMVTVRSRDAAKVKQTRAVMDAIKTAMGEYKAATGSTVPGPPYDPDLNAVQGGTLPPWHKDASFRTDFYREKDDTIDSWWQDPPTHDKPAEGISGPGQAAYAVNMTNTRGSGYKATKQRIFGIQALYYWLVSEPGTKALVNKIPASSLVTAAAMREAGYLEDPGDLMSYGDIADIPRRGRVIEVLVFVDAWGRPMHYGRHQHVNNNEAYLQSAGPDGKFGNEDDVYSF